LISSASSLAAASLITFGVLSTNSLASFKPRPVTAKEEAEEIKAKLEEVGAAVEVK
jgi:hypothetical protein